MTAHNPLPCSAPPGLAVQAGDGRFAMAAVRDLARQNVLLSHHAGAREGEALHPWRDQSVESFLEAVQAQLNGDGVPASQSRKTDSVTS